MDNNLLEKCFVIATQIKDSGIVSGEMGVEEITELLYKLELEKQHKNSHSDSLLEYNDEIVSIEEVGDLETIDISVSGDSLFYCNDILTKNSFGVPASTDLMLAMIATEELEAMNQILFKQLKNRNGDVTRYKRFLVGIDRPKMRLYDLEESAQQELHDYKKEEKDDKPLFDQSSFGRGMGAERKDDPGSRFNKEKFSKLK
jgi:hypothetical protein